MTDCNCACSTFGPGPHDKDARHPNPKACEHSEWPDHEDSIVDPPPRPYGPNGYPVDHEDEMGG